MKKDTRKALLWITNLLIKNKIPFYITGGFAARIYSSTRRLKDIDIDISEKDIEKLLPYVKKYITYGPKLLINKRWKTPLMTIKYYGQEIDFCGADNCYVFDIQKKKWVKCDPYFIDNLKIEVFGKVIPIIPPKGLIKYKGYLEGDHQKKDIQAIENYLSNFSL